MHLTKYKLLSMLCVLALALVAMNAGVGVLTRNSLPRRVMAHARQSEECERRSDWKFADCCRIR